MDKKIKPEIKERKVSVVVDLLKDRTAREEYLKFQEEYMQRISERYRKRRELERKAEKKWKDFVIKY
ncbi:hypothetical protein ES702_04186 [subsurface metagenome]